MMGVVEVPDAFRQAFSGQEGKRPWLCPSCWMDRAMAFRVPNHFHREEFARHRHDEKPSFPEPEESASISDPGQSRFFVSVSRKNTMKHPPGTHVKEFNEMGG
jgi:hypothetical protein